MAKQVKKNLPHETEIIIQLAVEGLIKGYSNSELVLNIKNSYEHIEVEVIEGCLRKALALIKDQTLTDIERIIPQHVELYEQIYQEYETLRYVPGKLKAMRAKERLLGLLKETNYVEIYNEVNVSVENEPEYDISKLSSDEQKRLNVLLKRVIRQ